MKGMGRVWSGLALAVATGLASAPAGAAPNALGTTGLILLPTADTQDYRSLALHGHIADDWMTYGGQFGLMERVEIGLSFSDGDPRNDLGVDPDFSTLVNGKWSVLGEGTRNPAVAVGVVDMFNDSRLGPAFYVVASKSLKLPTPLSEWSLRAHAGIGTGVYDELPFAGFELGVGYPFEAVSFGLPLTLMLETVDGRFNGGARVDFPFGLGVDFAYVQGPRGSSLVGGLRYRMQL